MRIQRTTKRTPPENTIPLINVVFLMLIFFLFAGSVARDDAKEVEPPYDITEDENIRSTGALVIDDEGQTHAGAELASVEEWLKIQEEEGEEGAPLKIAADGTLAADKLEEVLKQLREAGKTNLVLITRKGSQ